MTTPRTASDNPMFDTASLLDELTRAGDTVAEQLTLDGMDTPPEDND